MNYPGLASSPHHSAAMELFGGRAGGVLSFVLKGSPELTERFLEVRKPYCCSSYTLSMKVFLLGG